MRFCECITVFRWFLICATCAALAVPGTALASEDPELTSLRNEAATQLKIAGSAVREAERQKALWIPAVEALEEARAAFDRGEFEQAIKLSRSARQFAELGIRQLATPPYRHF